MIYAALCKSRCDNYTSLCSSRCDGYTSLCGSMCDDYTLLCGSRCDGYTSQFVFGVSSVIRHCAVWYKTSKGHQTALPVSTTSWNLKFLLLNNNRGIIIYVIFQGPSDTIIIIWRSCKINLWDINRTVTSWCNSINIFSYDDACKNECHTFIFWDQRCSSKIIQEITLVKCRNSLKRPSTHLLKLSSTILVPNWTLFFST